MLQCQGAESNGARCYGALGTFALQAPGHHGTVDREDEPILKEDAFAFSRSRAARPHRSARARHLVSPQPRAFAAAVRLIDPAAYYTRPIALRNPIVFYEGHLPAFSVIALIKRGLGRPRRGRSAGAAVRARHRSRQRRAAPCRAAAPIPRWPARDEVLDFGARADAADRRRAFDGGSSTLAGTTHRAMRRGEAIFTALEHEAMHQETLLYMWHRSAARAEDRAGGAALRARPRRRAGVDRGRFPPAPPRSARRATRIQFGWDNEFGEQRVAVAAFEIDVAQRHQRRVPRVRRRPAATRTRELWSRERLGVARERGRRASRVLDARGEAAGSGAGMFEDCPAAGRVAGLRQLRRSGGIRALARPPTADRSGVPPRRVRHAVRGRARVPVGRRAAGRDARQFRLRVVGAGALPARGPRARAPGASTISSATDGNGRRRSSVRCPASSRWRRTPNTPPTSSTASTTS